MISEATIMAKIKQYSNTANGKEKMRKAVSNAISEGRQLSNGTKIANTQEMNNLADILISIIQSHLPDSIKSVGGTLTHGTPVGNTKRGYEVKINFDRAALHRDSLENDLDYEGIDNIVALFNNGYEASNYVYGWWNGHNATGEAVSRSITMDEGYAWVRSKKNREALNFMQAAAEEFNAKYGSKYNVTVKLSSEYQK